MIVGERVAQPVRQGQHPLAHGQAAEDVRPGARPARPCAARNRTGRTPPLAREGDQDLAQPSQRKRAKPRASRPHERKSRSSRSTKRGSRARPAQPRLSEEGLEVLASTRCSTPCSGRRKPAEPGMPSVHPAPGTPPRAVATCHADAPERSRQSRQRAMPGPRFRHLPPQPRTPPPSSCGVVLRTAHART